MLTAQISTRKLIREMGSSDLISHYSALNDENDPDSRLRNLCIRCYKQITGTDLKWQLLVDRVAYGSL